MIRISVVSSPLPPEVKGKPLRSTADDEEIDPETLVFISDFLKATANNEVTFSAIIQLDDDQYESLEHLTDLFNLVAPQTVLSVSFDKPELPSNHPLVDQGVSLIKELLESTHQQLDALHDLEGEEFL